MKRALLTIAALILCASAGTSLGDVVRQTVGCAAPDEPCIHLIRNKNGLQLSGTIPGLIKGHAYSVWWIPVADPLFSNFLVLNATGGIANQAGELHFGAALTTGEYEEGDMKPGQVIYGGTFDFPLTALVFLDVLDHGPKIPGHVREQISTDFYGCGDPPEWEPCPSIAEFGTFLFLPQ